MANPTVRLERLIEMERRELFALAGHVQYLEACLAPDSPMRPVLQRLANRLEQYCDQLKTLRDGALAVVPPTSPRIGLQAEADFLAYALESEGFRGVLDGYRQRAVTLACAVAEARELEATTTAIALKQRLSDLEQDERLLSRFAS